MAATSYLAKPHFSKIIELRQKWEIQMITIYRTRFKSEMLRRSGISSFALGLYTRYLQNWYIRLFLKRVSISSIIGRRLFIIRTGRFHLFIENHVCLVIIKQTTIFWVTIIYTKAWQSQLDLVCIDLTVQWTCEVL